MLTTTSNKPELSYIKARGYIGRDEDYSKMSHPEHLFSNCASDLLNHNPDVAADACVAVLLYEWVSFNIPGGKYTPDFFVLMSDGSVLFIEVKQEAISKKTGRRYYAGRSSYRDSRSKLRAVAELNPWFEYYMAVYNNKTGWRLERVVPTRGLEWMSARRTGDEQDEQIASNSG